MRIEKTSASERKKENLAALSAPKPKPLKIRKMHGKQGKLEQKWIDSYEKISQWKWSGK